MARAPKPEVWKPKFIQALTDGTQVNEAATVAGISVRTAYNHRQSDEDFALDWADAIEAGTQELERVAIQRAKDKSDVLLIFLLKARRPDVYRDNVKVEHSGSVKHDLSGMSDAELLELDARFAR
jgi:hypothetical protein